MLALILKFRKLCDITPDPETDQSPGLAGEDCHADRRETAKSPGLILLVNILLPRSNEGSSVLLNNPLTTYF